MAGGTLVISRQTTNHDYFIMKLSQVGYTNVYATDLDKDALSFHIRETKPDIVIMSSRFYQCSTPYMMGLLRREFPKLYFAAVSVCEYPLELAMYFIINGVNAYVCTVDGIKQFYEGIEAIRTREAYIPLSVQERLNLRKMYPSPALKLAPMRTEVLRCVCTGFRQDDIAETLAISRRTVNHHLEELHRSLNATNTAELIAAALEIGIITTEELVFRHRNFICLPSPDNQRRKK
jgi:DNA-binding NarL/FixJ family response regulator